MKCFIPVKYSCIFFVCIRFKFDVDTLLRFKLFFLNWTSQFSNNSYLTQAQKLNVCMCAPINEQQNMNSMHKNKTNMLTSFCETLTNQHFIHCHIQLLHDNSIIILIQCNFLCMVFIIHEQTITNTKTSEIDIIKRTTFGALYWFQYFQFLRMWCLRNDLY